MINDLQSLNNFKLLNILTILSIIFLVISDLSASKLISVANFNVSITIFFFPIVLILGDIITEVYGYKVAKIVTQYSVFSSFIVSVLSLFVSIYPASSIFQNNEAYSIVFGVAPRIFVAGLFALYFGEITNNFILSKMKSLTFGKYLSLRTVSSTVVGQFVNTSLFYLIAFYNILPNNILFISVLSGWLIKVALEVVFTPVTIYFINLVKKIEKIDTFTSNNDYKLF